jgi:PTS system nitrogen regulatory IIA component
VRLCDILKEPLILSQLNGTDKEAILAEMAQHLSRHAQPLQMPPDGILQALLTRERLGSTGVGEGVAIPHAKIPGLGALVACFGRTPAGVAYDAIDYQPVKLVFMLLVPENSAGAHLKALARISRLLKNAAFRDRLLQLPDAATLWKAFVEEDSKHNSPPT